jgi:hypothetical protein
MSIISQLKSMNSGLKRVLRPLPPIVYASCFTELSTLIVERIRRDWSTFEPKGTGCVHATLGGTDFDFCMNECDSSDGRLRITYQLKTTDNRFTAPLREYTYTSGENQFNELIVYISTYTSQFSTAAKHAYVRPGWEPTPFY